MDQIVNLAKTRGFVYPGSEIYGGLANSWDYGPLGVEMKNNVKRAWWTKFVQANPHNVGIDAAILMNPETWVASGHVGGFNDPLLDCRGCKMRFRADKLIEDYAQSTGAEVPAVEAMSNAEMEAYIRDNVVCPNCGAHDFTPIRQFNLMFKTFQGVNEDTAAQLYLRPETAQGIFVNFRNVLRTTRRRLPLGIGQIGKSFRNEITPGNFIFRTREFEQMELEFFCAPSEEFQWFDYWRAFCRDWLLSLGIHESRIHMRDHSKDELSHYSNATTDIEFDFPFGRGELWGIADRTDFDLKAHAKQSGENFEYTDPVTGEKYVPYCIEPSLGADRVFLAFLCNAYDEETLPNGDVRTVLRLHPAIAPYTAAVLPLQKKLTDPAREIWSQLAESFAVDFDVTGSIGKRYRRQDEIGTPFCVTVDFDTLETNKVTVRNRDTMEQDLIPVTELTAYLRDRRAF